jgi:hypothetical protein
LDWNKIWIERGSNPGGLARELGLIEKRDKRVTKRNNFD